MSKRWLKWLVGAVVAAVLIVWGVGELYYPAHNPARVYAGTILSADSDAVLRGACFDCHSNETRHPWYRHVPGIGLFIATDIREGREHLNFSRWDLLDAEERRKAIAKALEAIDESEMPPFEYVWMHSAAKTSAAQVQAIQQDALARYGVRPGERAEHDDHEH